jgi:hypothetical protein
MGWKTFKSHFQINHHIVQVAPDNPGRLHIGYLGNLIEVDMATGVVTAEDGFSSFLRTAYPALSKASPAEVLAQLEAEDVFETSIPVFTFDGGDIIEKRCEALGWPYLTHDGYLMHKNRYHPDKARVVEWALQDAEAGAKYMASCVGIAQRELARLEALKSSCEANLAKLQALSDAQRLAKACTPCDQEDLGNGNAAPRNPC